MLRLFLTGFLLLCAPVLVVAQDAAHNPTAYLFYDGVRGIQVGPFNSKEECDKRVAALRSARFARKTATPEEVLDCWATDSAFVVVRNRWRLRSSPSQP